MNRAHSAGPELRRNPSALENGPFDVVVVGGGIYGAWTAYDAALRGLRVAIIDKGDWGSGTSSVTSKLIHGGVRYLEHWHFGLVRKTLRERRLLARIAPHRVLPLRFLVPVYRDSRVGPLRLMAGLWLYDRLGGRGQPVDPHRRVGRRKALERYPFLVEDGLRDAFSYGDCQTDDSRFVLELIAGAVGAGAVAVNYVEATKVLTLKSRALGVMTQDVLSGKTTEVRAQVVVNAAGPWASQLDVAQQTPTRVRLVKGVHLVMPALPTADAILVPAPDGRVVFMIPWYGRTILGTTDTDYEGNPDDAGVDTADVGYLLECANRVLRSPWDESDVQGRFAGVRALQDVPGPPSEVTREWRLEEPIERLLVSSGGKYTSARGDAARLVDRVLALTGNECGAAPTSKHSLPWSPGDRAPGWLRDIVDRGTSLGLDRESAYWCALRFGTGVGRVFESVEADPDLAARIVPDLPFCMAELVYAARAEMVATLEDLLRRRVPVLILARLARARVEELAAIVAPTLDWSPARRADEVEALWGEWGTTPVTN